MDSLLKNALDFSNYKQSLAIQKKTLNEKLDSQLTFGHNSGIFKIDRNLIVFVNFLVSEGRTENVVMLDFYNNPIMVENLVAFKDEILDRYFSTLLDHYQEHERIRKSRAIETLVDL